MVVVNQICTDEVKWNKTTWRSAIGVNMKKFLVKRKFVDSDEKSDFKKIYKT